MSISLTFRIVEARREDGRLYAPTVLQCWWASEALVDALLAIPHTDHHDGAAYIEVDGRRVDLPSDGREQWLVRAGQITPIQWEPLSEDPRGISRKRAAWAYLSALDPNVFVVVDLT